MLQLILDEPLEDMLYTLQLGPAIVGINELRFDQRKDVEGENPFVSQFGNTVDALGCPVGYLWDEEYLGCVAIADCSTACEAGYVCDQAQQQCVEDCRIFGSCIEPGQICSESTGLCS